MTARELATAIAGQVRTASESRWLAIGTVLAVSNAGVTVSMDGHAVTGINAIGSVQVGHNVLVGVVRGAASVQYIVVGALGIGLPAPTFTRFSISGDTSFAAVPGQAGDLVTFPSDQGDLTERGDGTATMATDANGHKAMVFGGDLLSGYANTLIDDNWAGWRTLTGPLHVFMAARIEPVDGNGAGASISYGTGPRSQMGLSVSSTGSYGSFSAWFFDATDASISARAYMAGGWDVREPHIYEARLNVDGTVDAWIDGVTPGGAGYYYEPTSSPQPLWDAERGNTAGSGQINWAAGPRFTLLEYIYETAPMDETERAALHASLMTKYLP